MDVETVYGEFINCDRAGRRNAVPDIKGECSSAGVSDLSEDIGELSIQGAEGKSETPSSDTGQEQSPKAQDGSSPS